MGGKTQPAADSKALPDDTLTRVEWTTEARDTADLARRYDAWAASYDTDLLECEGYSAVVQLVMGPVQRHVPREARILELGCGTGLVGRALRALGYMRLEGLDLSPGMLERAAETGAYNSLRPADLNDCIPEDDASCDAVIAVGTLTYLEPAVLTDICRVLVAGGHFVFTFQPSVHVSRGFQKVEDRLVAQGHLLKAFTSDRFPPLPNSMPEVRFRVSVLQKGV